MSQTNRPVSQPGALTLNTSFAGPQFGALCDDLARMAGELGRGVDWPERQLEQLAETGVLGWVIPKQFGGSEISPQELAAGYEQLAIACLTTTFILTQRNGACQRIAGSENGELKAELLPPLGRGDIFATVGISHLTTSRQHLRRSAVEVRQRGSDFVFNGTVPWVTGANHAEYIVTGGTCDDGKQVLAAIPTEQQGVVIHDPPRLLSLNASQTGAVQFDDVGITDRFLIAGPVEGVMQRGRGGGTGSLTTSALAVGTAERALRFLKMEAEQRPDLLEIYEPLESERAAISADISAATQGNVAGHQPPPSADSIRRRANSLVLRAACAYLGAAKGAGFVSGHPAERAVREAMFFLVWSCPQPVVTAALREFACVLAE